MRREILQIGRDVESLTRYITDYGDEASPQIIAAQARLIAIHVQDLMEAQGNVGNGKN